MQYRSEIDGLRAMAVIPVIFFHAGFEWFSGGFVGVDVFFAISGYLITSIILKEKNRDTFTIAKFYERRARRILPALFFVTLCTLPFAWFWMLPLQLKDFSQSLVAVSVFASNFLFWIESDYFAAEAEEKPLLHTWSLAVEEQYYVFFPLFIILLWGFGRQNLVYIIAVVSVFSFALAEYGWRYYPTANFYLAPARVWELLAGALCAFYLFDRRPLKSNLLSGLGLALIVYSIFALDETTPFPSVYTLAPVIGSCLVILFGAGNTVVARFLSTKVLVGIGLISYSAYLWHFPLFAFARIRTLAEPSSLLMLALSLMAFTLAYFSWRYIERPFREKRVVISMSKPALTLAALCTLFLVSAGLIGHRTDGNQAAWLEGLNDAQREIYSYLHYDTSAAYRRGECLLFDDHPPTGFSESCVARESAGDSMVIWGDSHAAALSYGLRARHEATTQFSKAGCPPILDIVKPRRPYCRAANEYVLSKIEQLKPDHILLHANWKANRKFIKGDEDASLRQTLISLKKIAPHSTITVIGGVPYWANDLPKLLIQKLHTVSGSGLLYNPHQEHLREIDSLLMEIASDGGVQFVSLLDGLCSERGCKVLAEDASAPITPLVWDEAHLTKEGSLLAADIVLGKLEGFEPVIAGP